MASKSKDVYADNPNDMHYKNGTVYGKGWHGRPGMYAGGSVTFTRDSESNKTVTFNGNIKTTMAYGSSSSPNWYSYPITARMYVGGTNVKMNDAYSITLHDYSDDAYDYNEYSVHIQGSFQLDNNSTAVTIVYYCNYQNVEGGCDEGTPYCTTFTLDANALPYVPYKDPKIAEFSYSGKGIRRADGNTLADIQLQKCTLKTNTQNDGANSTTKLTINGKEKDASYGNGDHTPEWYPYNYAGEGETLDDGKSYTVTAKCTHNETGTSTSASLTFYTYTRPKVSNVSLDNATFSPQNSNKITWLTNSRKWVNSPCDENDFETSITFGGKNVSDVTQAPTNSVNGSEQLNITEDKTLASNTMLNLFSDSERSKAEITGQVIVKRKSSSASISSSEYSDTAQTSFTLKLQPQKSVNSVVYKGINPAGQETGTISPGDTVIINHNPNLKINWNYPYTDIAAGIASGYIINVYRDNTYSGTKVYTTEVSNTISGNIHSGTVTIETAILARGVLNYLEIIPYYTWPNETGRSVGDSSTYFRQVLIKPVSILDKPVIEYPTGLGSWHNKGFRICLKAPNDPDLQHEIDEGLITSEADYRYKAIELDIKIDSGNYTTYTFANNSNIFSTVTIDHKKALVLNPSLITNFGLATSKYTIRIRFQKNYFYTGWSEYSDEVVLNISDLDRRTFTAGVSYVMATDFNSTRHDSNRLYNSYSHTIINDNTDTIMRTAEQDPIAAMEYKSVYDNVLAIQTTVNDYATFDTGRDNIKFNNTLTVFDSPNDMPSLRNPKEYENITADLSKTDTIHNIQGRNYRNMLVNIMDLLK